MTSSIPFLLVMQRISSSNVHVARNLVGNAEKPKLSVVAQYSHKGIINWRAGASQPSRVNGPIFLYIYIYICDSHCTYRNVIRASNFADALHGEVSHCLAVEQRTTRRYLNREYTAIAYNRTRRRWCLASGQD